MPGDAQIVTLRTALEDPVADVRWNAAIALARHGNREGVAVLKQMLDRGYLAQSVAGAAQAGADIDPAGEVMISSLQAVASLRETSLRAEVESISREDKNMRVRQAALEVLKVIQNL